MLIAQHQTNAGHCRKVCMTAKIGFCDPKLMKRLVWECATRKTRGSAGVDAVAMLALISHPSSPFNTLDPASTHTDASRRTTIYRDSSSIQATSQRDMRRATGWSGR